MNKWVVFFFTGFLAFLYSPNPDVDLYRYYEFALAVDTRESVIAFVRDTYLANFDFVYFSSFYIFKKLGLPKELVTGLFVGLFYSQVLWFIELAEARLVIGWRKSTLLKFFALCCISPVIILSISRNLAAIAIFLVGLNMYILGRRSAYLYFIISCFTHIVMVAYIAAAAIFFKFRRLHFSSRFWRNLFLVLGTIAGLTSKFWIYDILDRFATLSFFEKYLRYSMYVDKNTADLGSVTEMLSIYDILPVFMVFSILIAGLFFIKKYNGVLWVAYYFCLALAVSIGYSAMFTQRTLMFSVPFLTFVVMGALREFKNHRPFLFIFRSMILMSVALFCYNVFSYRVYLFS